MKFAWLLVSVWVSGRAVAAFSERCDDWGVIPMQQTQVYDGEPARIRCPLFQDFLKHNYSMAHSAGLTLMWYWIGREKDLEEPINFRLPDNRITKEKETLWFKPAMLNDTGNYTCMLRNTSYCSKVAFPLEVLQKDPGSCVSQFAKPEVVELPAGHFERMTCPDVDGFYPPNETPAVSWYLGCKLVHNFVDRHPQGVNLTFTDVLVRYEGNYTCVLTYEEHGRRYNVTRTTTMKVIGSPFDERPPVISQSIDKVVQEIEAGDKAQIYCKVEFSFVKGSRTDVWWTTDGKNAGDLLDPRINTSTSVQEQDLGKKTITVVLSIRDVTAEDLKRNYSCVAKNDRGQVSWQALLKLKVPPHRYVTELACGLGVTLFLVVVLIIIYHVFWLEMVLFYRARFGTDETVGDGKEYDVYVSYARNAEEEEFVLLTLRGVLENEFGYKLCIFDRDSLPGGILTDETLAFINKSRRLLVILSPNYAHEGTQAFLELKAGLANMASQGSIRVILVQYKSLKNTRRVKELKRAQAVLSVIKWKGEKSKNPRSRFWKQLHVALPSKKLHARISSNNVTTYYEEYSLSPYPFTAKDSPRDGSKS